MHSTESVNELGLERMENRAARAVLYKLDDMKSRILKNAKVKRDQDLKEKKPCSRTRKRI